MYASASSVLHIPQNCPERMCTMLCGFVPVMCVPRDWVMVLIADCDSGRFVEWLLSKASRSNKSSADPGMRSRAAPQYPVCTCCAVDVPGNRARPGR